MNEIKIGKITEKELVELYGSDSQKKFYKENGVFNGSYKQALLKKMNNYCKIEELKKKKNNNKIYNITEVYKHPLPSNFNKMNKSLYKYIVPLILDKLIHGHDENNSIDITVGKWAREINMINHNYNLIKYNREDGGKEFQIRMNEMNEFYDKSDQMINWYIENALDYLKSAGLIIWRQVNRVTVEESEVGRVVNSDGKIEVNVTTSSHQASKEEMDYYSQCIFIADKEANIENASERYYSHKAKVFQAALKRELYKQKIKFIYSTYEAYYVHLDKCMSLLEKFGKYNSKVMIDEFNKEFSNMLVENAGVRFDKNKAKYLLDKDEYLLSFENLCEITIDNNTEYLGKRISNSKKNDDYDLQVTHKEENF